jgi:DNA end-binding protein Ku
MVTRPPSARGCYIGIMAAPRSMETAAISFGLVTVPVRVYPAVRTSAGLSFHLLHAKDGARLKQQYLCAKDEEVVPRSEMIKGYEYSKGRYVTFSDEELKALDQRATQGIEIAEFVAQDAVDPVYYERSYYVGPDKGGDKPFALLSEAMKDMKLAAVARYAARGKDYLVLLRPSEDRMVMHQLYHSDEIRELSEVPAARREVGAAELRLARQLIEQITSDTFEPQKYEDEVRKRVKKLIQQKVQGKDITPAKPAGGRGAKVVDLMEALKASLEQKGRQRAPVAARRGAAAKTVRAAGKTRSRKAS